jgi:hypothetical protein
MTSDQSKFPAKTASSRTQDTKPLPSTVCRNNRHRKQRTCSESTPAILELPKGTFDLYLSAHDLYLSAYNFYLIEKVYDRYVKGKVNNHTGSYVLPLSDKSRDYENRLVALGLDRRKSRELMTAARRAAMRALGRTWITSMLKRGAPIEFVIMLLLDHRTILPTKHFATSDSSETSERLEEVAQLLEETRQHLKK